MYAIRSYYVSFNKFTEIPEALGKLTLLERLDLSHNDLNKLPSSFINLTNIIELNLEGNRLTDLPFGKVERLKNINLKGNPLNQELLEANKQGLDAVKAYLRAKTVITSYSIHYTKLYEIHLSPRRAPSRHVLPTSPSPMRMSLASLRIIESVLARR